MAKNWSAISQGVGEVRESSVVLNTHSQHALTFTTSTHTGTHTCTHCRAHSLAPCDDYKNVQFRNTYFPFGNKPTMNKNNNNKKHENCKKIEKKAERKRRAKNLQAVNNPGKPSKQRLAAAKAKTHSECEYSWNFHLL